MTEATPMIEGAPPSATPEIPVGSDRQKDRKPRGRNIGFIIAGLLAAGVIVIGFRALFGHKDQQVNSAPTVAVAKAAPADLVENVVLTAEFFPYQDIDLHAKVSGFVKSITVDIGDRVKEGQTIAELEVPELRDELNKASASLQASMEDVKRAEADYNDAHLNYSRLVEVARERPKLVAQQEIDNLHAKESATAGALGAAQRKVEESQAEQSRLKTLLAYTLIVVPFDGVITVRYADTGALIEAGTSSNTAMPLVKLAQENLLRLRFPVPESSVPLVHLGETVEFRVPALSETNQGKIIRFADKVDRATRTMVTEVDVPNPADHFKPGMYAYVTLPLREKKNALAVPVQALAPGAKPTVTIVNQDGEVQTAAVTTGLQTPDLVEITTGLKEGDLVVIGSRTGLRPGTKVSTKPFEPPKGY
jgi:RND family efflux transporter MFP subunit